MKIALISLVTPTATNLRVASALPYHLIDCAPVSVTVDVFSFNVNGVNEKCVDQIARELGVHVRLIKQSTKDRKVFARRLKIRALNSFPPHHYLSLSKNYFDLIESEYDCVWIYGEDIAHLSKLFPDKKVVVTTPDCEALYYKRLLDMKQSLLKRLRYIIAYDKYKRLVRKFDTNAVYHLVGESDRDYLLSLNPGLDAYFIRHPHYEMRPRNRQLFSDQKIKLLIAGRNDIYMEAPTSEAIDAMCKCPELAGHYKVTFLGKGWEPLEVRLHAAGYDTQIKTWVDDYIGEISNYDIQLTPICVGTGTKGKVLDAFANGLLVIGTERAIENIAVVNGESCILYNNPEKLIKTLSEIPIERPHFAYIAENGHIAIQNHHGKKVVSDQFFGLFIEK